VRVWALASRQGEALTGHSHWVTSVAWSGDGTRVCSGSGDRTVCLWQVEG
jgi:WD40 repeat protein